jgi:hypothetical protein
MIEEKVVEYLEKLDKLATELAPQGYDMALQVVQINAVQSLVVGFIGLVIAIFCARVVWWALTSEDIGYSSAPAFAALLGVIGCLGGMLAFTINVLSVWNWIGLFHPELYLAKQLMGM